MPPDNALVEAWDRAQRGAPWQRPVSLAMALSGVPGPGLLSDGAPGGGGSLADAPVGAVARRMLELAAAWFGPSVDALFACRTCGDAMEARLDVAALLDAASAPSGGPFELTTATGEVLLVRLPSPVDVAAAAQAERVDGAVQVLLDRTVLEAPDDFDAIGHVDAISAAFEARDPLGTVTVDVVCPVCATFDQPALDVAAWFWARADAQVRRLLDDVHALASAYGWSEHEVLALGPYRRAIYLDWVG